MTAAEETEAFVMLLQPDMRTRRAYTYSKTHQMNERVKTYSKIGLMIKDSNDEEEIASELDNARNVIVTVTVGPTPLVASVADYGGAGQKYELIVYSPRSPVTITPLEAKMLEA